MSSAVQPAGIVAAKEGDRRYQGPKYSVVDTLTGSMGISFRCSIGRVVLNRCSARQRNYRARRRPGQPQDNPSQRDQVSGVNRGEASARQNSWPLARWRAPAGFAGSRRLSIVTHYSRLCAVVIDVPSVHHDLELAFWQAAIGEPLTQLDQHPEYHGDALHGQEFCLLVQRLDEGPGRVHLDIHTDDPLSEVAR